MLYNVEFIQKFFVGLMDGLGSIQVNHLKKTSLQFRLSIQLENLPENITMLTIFVNLIGGKINVVEKLGISNSILWVINNKQEILKVVQIFEKYPPLTFRLQCQLLFLNNCLKLNENSSISNLTLMKWYFDNRKIKYVPVKKKDRSFVIPEYFNCWLSGFIEGVGCFIIREANKYSFFIHQKDENLLLSAIQYYFAGVTSVLKLQSKFYILDISNKKVIKKIINHCTNVDHPLLGYKMNSLIKFNEVFKS